MRQPPRCPAAARLNSPQLRRSSRYSAFAVVLLAWLSGCGAEQRAAEKLIDPRLHSEGVLIERQIDDRDLVLGRYRVERVVITEQPFDGTGPLAPDANGRTRPTQQVRLEFALVGGETEWLVECVGQRRQPSDHDLASELDEAREEVAVSCQLAGGEQRWTLRIAGTLADNLVGRLEPVGSEGGRTVELVLYHRLFSLARRRLPASLALIHDQTSTDAALILDSPERAWLAPELDDSKRELALASLLALRLIPLGFDS
jgi:hypothetical protein